MGNLFLGFPVARAKIADMIATAAPPLAHHTQHENGGSDEIDVTGLTGLPSGGLGIGGVVNFTSNFESLTYFLTATSGSATITQDTWQTKLYTGFTLNSAASIARRQTSVYNVQTWNKDHALIADINYYSTDENKGQLWIINGIKGNGKHIGFKLSGGVLYGTVGNGSAETTVALQTTGTAGTDYYKSLRAVFTTGSKCEFYVDGVLLGTITTGLPSGAHSSDTYFWAEAINTEVNTYIQLYLASYNIQITQ